MQKIRKEVRNIFDPNINQSTKYKKRMASKYTLPYNLPNFRQKFRQ